MPVTSKLDAASLGGTASATLLWQSGLMSGGGGRGLGSRNDAPRKKKVELRTPPWVDYHSVSATEREGVFFS